MPTVLQLQFPGGSYHATPWGHHVNEGLVEWPPSPWRLLRALLATGFTKAGWALEGPPPGARSLVSRLAPLAPRFHLPQASPGHSRHYVDAAGKKPLILDPFLRIEEGGVLEIVWDVELPDEEKALLARLAGLLGYLGRAESWVEARVVDEPTRRPNCVPAADDAGPPGPGWEGVAVLGAVSSEFYAAWRRSVVDPIEAQFAPPAGRKRPAGMQKKLDKALAPFPPDLVDALCAETGWLQAHGWSSAPGSRWLRYWRPARWMEPAPRAFVVRGGDDGVPFALLALSTPTRNRSALPPLRRTLAQGRLLHRALAANIHEDRGAAMVLLGRDGDELATGPHTHAHLLHLDLDGDGYIDHVLVWAPQGLAAAALRVLRRVRRTWMKGGVGELQVAFAGAGDADALRGATMVGAPLARVLGQSGGAVRWRSVTPFVAPRFTTPRGKDSVVGQVRRELGRRGFPDASVTLLGLRDGGREHFRHFVLRDARHAPPALVPFAVEVEFQRPVEGPICLGFGAHAGLGRFEVA